MLRPYEHPWSVAEIIMDTLEKLYASCRALNRRFPDGNDPFHIMTCLLEERRRLQIGG